MLSPFIGGGALEIELAKRGVRIIGYDVEASLVCYWRYQLSDPFGLYDAVRRLGTLTKEQAKQAQNELPHLPDSLERAALYYLVNKSAFMGMTLAGGITGRVPSRRTTHDIHHFRVKNMSVDRADFRTALTRHADMFAYLDPPYLFENPSAARLYGDGLSSRKGNLHLDFDHEGLRDLITDREQWIMSNSDNQKVRTLYAGFKMITPRWSYGGRSECQELLIFSRDLSPKITTDLSCN